MTKTIGLVRHFKVNKEFPLRQFVTVSELIAWLEEYDIADIHDGTTDLRGFNWGKCFASDLPRAIKTARSIYDGEITIMPELRELTPPSFNTNIRIPFIGWGVLFKMAPLLSRRYRKMIREVEARINRALDVILSSEEEHILVVSHWALMLYMRKQLVKRGFKGPRMRQVENGKLHVFQAITVQSPYPINKKQTHNQFD
ncbi:phosphoglycerate mutase [Paenibacillus sp. CFBP13512]|uniref:histidine phosphatase family protein n=1 Tax=Paenibacillus sp. CFBP13512 TaxID=2184007 RepID=UPI0010BFF478|nr:histidine phosphatase family protein [Paenibacillus sp. CFBP13512]TKJ87715.1 phosphoglycerate mutase [Paenibacillus sp. CFBP13512]